ncbi:MAG TPA: hypothetical protein VGU25_07620 [Acidobacteriaceae bacterium]|nr:hypothetical protein [Acidobacteriaceae bacterium]
MLAVAAVVTMFHCAIGLRAQIIQIKIVDGRTGRPVSGACVGAWIKDASNKMSLFIPADKDGAAQLRVTQKERDVDISYNPKLGCGGTGAINPILKYGDTLSTYSTGDHPSCAFAESIPNARWNEIDFSTEEVLQHGVASANTCGNVTVSPKPAEVILFVRPRNFHEKVQDWKASEAFPF